MQTVMVQHSFDCQFYPTVKNHFWFHGNLCQVDHNYISEGAKQSGNCLKDMGAAPPLSHITSVGGVFPLLLTCKVPFRASLKEVMMPLPCVGDLVWTCKLHSGCRWKRWWCLCPLLVTWCGHVKCHAGRHWKRWWCPMSCVSDLVCLGVELFSLSVTVNSRIQTETFTDGHLGQTKLKMEDVILAEPHATTFLCPKPQDFARVKFHEDSTEVIWLRL